MLRVNPFLQVTNRELSLFLWENPEYMRVYSKEKSSYLPGFQFVNRVTMDIASADHYVQAPPEILFLYHTWDRLVRKEFTERPIMRKEFIDFLKDAPEWLPRYWLGVPTEYVKLIQDLPSIHVDNLSDLPLNQLPMNVRMAFQGWKNFYKEGDGINHVQPTVEEMQQFLKTHPHYARNFWRNIVEKQTPNYLKDLQEHSEGSKSLSEDNLTAFLKVAFYNYQMSQK